MIKKSTSASFFLLSYTICLITVMSSCASSKRGCPGNGANVGAERVMTNEKGLKKSKFKIKGMQ